MSEIKTAPVKAIHIPIAADFADEYWRGKVPGSFRVDEPDDQREQTFWYCCPCGCGSVGPLLVGNGFKPARSPSWTWNGSTDAPVLSPSVNHVGHWHGWLGGSDGKSPGMWLSA